MSVISMQSNFRNEDQLQFLGKLLQLGINETKKYKKYLGFRPKNKTSRSLSVLFMAETHAFWTMDDGRWTMDDGRWTVDGRWSMVEARAGPTRTFIPEPSFYVKTGFPREMTNVPWCQLPLEMASQNPPLLILPLTIKKINACK